MGAITMLLMDFNIRRKAKAESGLLILIPFANS
jgi:hypothetical protein